MAPSIIIPKDVYIALNENVNDKYTQAILYGLREECDNKNITIQIKGFVPFGLKDSNLNSIISTLLNNNGQTVVGWFSNISYKYILSKRKENVSFEYILQEFSSKNFENFYTLLLNSIFINSAKIKKLYNQEIINQIAKKAYPILQNIIGVCFVSGNLYAFNTPNINIRNVINNITEGMNDYYNSININDDYKRKISKNEINFSKDGPFSIINQKKRRNEMDNNINNKKKKIINSLNDVQFISKSEIKILYGQSSEYLNSCINKSSLQYCTDYDEISFMGMLNQEDTYDLKLKRNLEKIQNSLPPDSIIKKEKMISDYINKDITSNYFYIEKKLRETKKLDDDKKDNFHDKEQSFLKKVIDNKNISENEFLNQLLNKIPTDLIFTDYITYYLQKYRNENNLYKKDDHYHKLLEILLKIRFDEEKKIIKNNNGNKINILLIKLIWLESNINFIQDIFKIYENSVNIYNNNSNKLIKNIEDLIFKEKSINYITDKQTKHAKEVNECYYIFLASICYCITSDEINLFDLSKQNKRQDSEIDINHYYFLLTEVNKTLQKLSDDLNITLNEMYIIDELIKVIELFKKNKDIQKINEIKNTLRKNAQIIQEFHIEENEQNDDSFNLDEELQKNFDELYKLLTKKDKSVEKDKIFYDKIRYIFFKEIKKIPFVNYRAKILDIILEENEIIKKSNNIFQILLEEYLKDSYDFNNNLKHILNGDDALIKLVEEKLENKNYVLSETLLYLFEKNSIKYLQFILNNDKKDKKGEKNLLEDEPLEILKYCIQFLDYYISKPKDVESKKKETGKLFSLGYIKVYIYLFIKMFDDKKPKFKKPEKIIEVLNGKESVYKMIRIYTYKSIYNNYKISAFTENKEKFKLKIYSDFNSLFKANELSNIYKIDYIIKTLKNDNYDNSYNAIDKYKKEDFNNKLDKDDFDLEEFGIDNFFAVSYNLILSDLLLNKSKGNDKFYKNICEPLFDGEGQEILLKSIKLFYDPETFNNIKTTYEINSNNIGSILFGYRICLNEIYNKKDRGIYYPLYIENNINKINDKYYPGNDTEFNLANYEVINHFKSKPEEGCYVCLCEKRYYHSIPSFFPGIRELNLICPECGQKNWFREDWERHKRREKR